MRLRECLEADAARLREVVAATDLASPVPTCPEWTVTELTRHVGAVYLHKVECIRTQSNPDPWPPQGLAEEEPRGLLDRGYAALLGELDRRKPDAPAFTWYVPDQTVGFWTRRMAHETVVHRVDAELAAGVPRAPIPADLAVDGVDEFLSIFIAYGSKVWPEDFASALAGVGDQSVRLATSGASWTVRSTSELVEVTPHGAGDVALTVTAEPAELLLWVWQRLDDTAVTVDGDETALRQLRQIFHDGSQ